MAARAGECAVALIRATTGLARLLLSTAVDSFLGMKKKAVRHVPGCRARGGRFVSSAQGAATRCRTPGTARTFAIAIRIASISSYDTRRVHGSLRRPGGRQPEHRRARQPLPELPQRELVRRARRSTAPTAPASSPDGASKALLEPGQDRIAHPHDPDPRVGDVVTQQDDDGEQTASWVTPSHMAPGRRLVADRRPWRRRSRGSGQEHRAGIGLRPPQVFSAASSMSLVDWTSRPSIVESCGAARAQVPMWLASPSRLLRVSVCAIENVKPMSARRARAARLARRRATRRPGVHAHAGPASSRAGRRPAGW